MLTIEHTVVKNEIIVLGDSGSGYWEWRENQEHHLPQHHKQSITSDVDLFLYKEMK